MPWRGFDALPPYFGGKRRLCPRVFKEIARFYPREVWATLRLIDPFLGGGSVSLYAKAQGFGVLCGDIAERSFIIGKALFTIRREGRRFCCSTCANTNWRRRKRNGGRRVKQ